MTQNYKTRQRELITKLLVAHAGEHFTAAEITGMLASQGASVGKATVYRCLELMIASGEVKKYSFGEGESACYEYQNKEGHLHYHLRCSDCGELSHMECEYLDSLPHHVFEHHGFVVDPASLVLVGRCEKCTEKQGQEKQGGTKRALD